MKILIIDDKAEERTRAMEAVTLKGWDYILYDPTDKQEKKEWFNLITEVDAIVTDLFWKPYFARGGEVPSGLLVVIHAKSLGKPVVICTDAVGKDPRGHHGEVVGWIYDGYLAGIRKNPTFEMCETKDWGNALDTLEWLMKKGKEVVT